MMYPWLDYEGLTYFSKQLREKLKSAFKSEDEKITEAENNIEAVKNSIVDTVYPVGSVYISTAEVSPQELFGGTWEQIEDKFLLASGSTYEAGEEGGEAVHTLSVSELPAHTHGMNNHTHSIPALSGTAASAGAHTHSGPSHTHSIPALSGTAASAGSHSHGMHRWHDAASGSGAYIPCSSSHSTNTLGSGLETAGAHTHSVTTTSNTSGTSGTGATGSAGAHTHSITTVANTTGESNGDTESTGLGESFNEMPPYLAVYMWKRIA